MLAKVAPSEILNLVATEAGSVERQFSVHEESADVGIYVESVSGFVEVKLYSIVGGVRILLQDNIYTNRMNIPTLINLPPAFGQYEVEVIHSSAVTIKVWAKASTTTSGKSFTTSGWEGNRDALTSDRVVQEVNSEATMQEVLAELKKMNTYLAMFANHKL